MLATFISRIRNCCMKKTRWYIRFTSSFLAIWLLTLAIGGHAVSTHKLVTKSEASASNKKSQKPTQETPTIQVLSIEAVVASALSFDFSQEFYFHSSSFTIGHSMVALSKCFAIFYFYFSFFRYVFGTYIAINAP